MSADMLISAEEWKRIEKDEARMRKLLNKPDNRRLLGAEKAAHDKAHKLELASSRIISQSWYQRHRAKAESDGIPIHDQKGTHTQLPRDTWDNFGFPLSWFPQKPSHKELERMRNLTGKENYQEYHEVMQSQAARDQKAQQIHYLLQKGIAADYTDDDWRASGVMLLKPGKYLNWLKSRPYVDPETAEDIYQDAVLRVLRSQAQEPDDDFPRWFMTIVQRTYLDWVKYQLREKRTFDRCALSLEHLSLEDRELLTQGLWDSEENQILIQEAAA